MAEDPTLLEDLSLIWCPKCGDVVECKSESVSPDYYASWRKYICGRGHSMVVGCKPGAVGDLPPRAGF